MAREPLRYNVPIVLPDGAPTEQFQRLWQQLPESRVRVESAGQNVTSASKVLGEADKGTNILIVTSGITITFPATGYRSGQGVAVSNVSGGNVTLSCPGGSDFGTTLPNNGSFFAFCDGGGFWRQYCYSTSRL